MTIVVENALHNNNRIIKIVSLFLSPSQKNTPVKMSEPSVDRPPPDNQPDPNNRIREFLKQYNEQHPLNAESEDEEAAREQANQSPPPNCSICLGRVKSKCFTDSCMHQFCFNCLLQWSKVSVDEFGKRNISNQI